MGLPFIPAELREGADEIDLARRGKIPHLIGEADIKGILHAHTDASDGVASLNDMAKAVKERGYAFFGVSDHEAQHAAIDGLNRTFGANFRIFKGIEADILVDGSLDYPNDLLARFDFVIASVPTLTLGSQTSRH